MTRDFVIVACAISAGIHAALAPEHFRESTGAGVAFLAAAVILAAVAVALTLRPGSALLLGVAIASLAGLLGSYALAATTGLPLLHPEPEPVTGLALFTKAVEATGLLAAVSSLTNCSRSVAAQSTESRSTTKTSGSCGLIAPPAPRAP